MTAARPTLVGLPYDASSSYLRGPARAPALIRAAIHTDAGNSWTETMHDLAAAHGLADAGDLLLPESGEARAHIEAGVAAILAGGGRPIALGGDHSVTYPVLRAIAGAHGPVTLLHVDAHPDLYEAFDGDRYSHACPMARILEEGLVRRLVQVGIRTMNAHQHAQVARYGVEVITMAQWHAGARPVLTGPLYMSIDLDGMDPAHVPGVSHWESGGLSVRDVLALIHTLPDPVVGADVVEFNPMRDESGRTALVAAKLARELAGVMMGQIARARRP